MVSTQGQLQVNTASYRGGFSSVLINSLREAGLGSRVLITQFLKGGVSQGPQGVVQLCGTLDLLRPAIPCCISSDTLKAFPNSLKTELHKTIKEIWDISKKSLLRASLDRVVFDEIGLAIEFGLMDKDEVISVLESRPRSTDVILTGPSIPEEILNMADQVTQVRCN